MVQTAGEDEQEEAAEAAEAFLAEELPESIFGAPKAGAGMWASCLRVMHPTEGRTLDLVQFEQNEAAFRYVGPPPAPLACYLCLPSPVVSLCASLPPVGTMSGM